MQDLLSDKQLKFIVDAQAKWNLAHGAVRTGKTVGATFAFMYDVEKCPDNQINIVGHTFDTAYRNVIKPLLEAPQFAVFRPFLTWSGKKLYYKTKCITVLGAKDEGAIGNFQGDTHSLTYCDEITLYPESIIDMIDTRLSKSYSKAYATMNPTHPNHKVKRWIDEAEKGNSNYYSLHFTLDDNPFVPQDYKDRLRDSLSGVFYKRNYLGLWCLAEGSIFDFFDYDLHTVARPPRAAEYYTAAIDYGASNPFACLLVGVNTGRTTQSGKQLWVEDEYYYDPNKMNKGKVNSEYADDVQRFLDPYGVKQVYIDPSAKSFKLELGRRGLHPVDANNDVEDGIRIMTSELRNGKIVICRNCKNLIREVESYVWDKKQSEKGYDEPVKKNDHAIDSLRYLLATHKVTSYDQSLNNKDPSEYMRSRFDPGIRRY
jgi:PBSX family phage terminase large subunit